MIKLWLYFTFVTKKLLSSLQHGSSGSKMLHDGNKALLLSKLNPIQHWSSAPMCHKVAPKPIYASLAMKSLPPVSWELTQVIFSPLCAVLYLVSVLFFCQERWKTYCPVFVIGEDTLEQLVQWVPVCHRRFCGSLHIRVVGLYRF